MYKLNVTYSVYNPLNSMTAVMTADIPFEMHSLQTDSIVDSFEWKCNRIQNEHNTLS